MAVVAVALVLLTGVAASRQPAEPSTTRSHLPPLLDCGPAPAVVTPGDIAFRANVLSLLRGIPSAAVAAPAGAVTARSGRAAGHGRAFARALCFGAANDSSSTAAACRACLSAAASDLTGGCGGAASRRAGVWRAGCFLSYADTGAASAREDAFRGWFYATAAAPAAATLEGGVCAGDRTGAPAADCGRCLDGSARAAAALPWPVRMRGEEVIVVGYGCCLRVRISVLPMPSESATRDIGQFLFVLWMLFMVVAELAIVAGLLEIIVVNLGDIPQPVQ